MGKKTCKLGGRGSGIMLPITSLPSRHGIGTFGKAAYAFIDQLVAAGQRYWQILPLVPTGFCNSPYLSCSAFAGNPYLIDLDLLVADGLLTQEEVDGCDFGDDPSAVNYALIYRNRFTLLRRAFARQKRWPVAAGRFFEENRFWLDDYCLYMAVKLHFGDRQWTEWAEDIRLRGEAAMERYCDHLAEEIGFWRFCQFWFEQQWHALKRYANQRGVVIIGDCPEWR